MKAPESIIPILYSKNIVDSINYYTNILGFESQWVWEDAPTFGGVNWGEVRLFFCKDGQGSPGTWLCINVVDVDAYYEMIKTRGAKVISPPEDKPWFMREMLVVDLDGHMIRFGHGIECD